MGAGRKTETFYASANPNSVALGAPGNNSIFPGFRNLQKSDLGGVIFGCKNGTMEECLTKQLFGLPAMHYSYIRNIDAGLPLFLFNYSDRQMHGIFEAAGCGQTNIDPYAWSDGGTARTPYPAQVRIFTRTPCLPLREPQFKKVIGDNYFKTSHFWFELDRAQTKKLISLFTPANSGYVPLSVPPVDKPPTTLRNAQPNISYKNTLLTHLNPSNPASAPAQDNASPSKAGPSDIEVRDNWEVRDTWGNQVEWEGNYNNDTESGLDAAYDNNDLGFKPTRFCGASGSEFDEQTVLNRLRALALEREEQIACASENLGNEHALDAEPKVRLPGESLGISHLQLPQSNVNHELMELVKELVVQITELQKKQIESEKEVKCLSSIVNQSERKIFQSESRIEELEQTLGISARYTAQSEKLIYLVGGYDNVDWLSSLDAFVPSKDRLMPLKRMSGARAYTSVATLGEVIFVIGGGDGNSWSDIVECYNRSLDGWIQCPPLNCSKGSLAGIALGGKILAIGGGDGENCFSCVEMLDPSVGKWVYSDSMNEKLLGMIGRYCLDDVDNGQVLAAVLVTVEGMNDISRLFAPAAIEFNGAIYTVGGYDGKRYLRSSEMYDPREGYWARLPSMTERRGCLSLGVINEKLYAVGGFDGANMVSSVEIFDPRLPSWVPGTPMQNPRCYAGSAVINDTIYMMGGLSNGDEVSEIVECFDERNGWYDPAFKSIGKRCFFSAVVM